ncbi:MAG: hypothetical protein R3332_10070 [Pseudohongiellaceae bacterium]|nr:hypothetical protein [Pseudohongiellaceae bacterium]
MADKPMVKLKKAFEERPPAEKAIIAFIVCVGISYLYLILVSDPVKADIARLTQQISTDETRLSSLQARQQRAETRTLRDPNEAARAELAQLIERESRAREELDALTGSVIGPVEMNRLLTDVLNINDKLYLRRVENSGAQRITGGAGGQSVFRHNLSLEFEGDYLSTLQYLVYLESLTENFYWDSISIVPTQWPSATVRLELHTLSSEESYVGV